jgi:aspartate carbamoyltransferase regulatory subunit
MSFANVNSVTCDDIKISNGGFYMSYKGDASSNKMTRQTDIKLERYGERPAATKQTVSLLSFDAGMTDTTINVTDDIDSEKMWTVVVHVSRNDKVICHNTVCVGNKSKVSISGHVHNLVSSGADVTIAGTTNGNICMDNGNLHVYGDVVGPVTVDKGATYFSSG